MAAAWGRAAASASFAAFSEELCRRSPEHAEVHRQNVEDVARLEAAIDRIGISPELIRTALGYAA